MGVGKSTVGWEIFTQLTDAGVKTAYVDGDQLDLCYPVPPNHGGDDIRQRNLAAIWPNFRAEGIRCVIVSRDVETGDDLHSYTDRMAGTALTACRLRVASDELRQRFTGRGWNPHLADVAVRDAEALDRSDFADLVLNTDGLPVRDVARLVREQAGGWPPEYPPNTRPRSTTSERWPEHGAAPPASASVRTANTRFVPVLWLCGPTAVGKSTVGWEIFNQVVRSGVKAAYVDLAQISFCRPAPYSDPDNHRIKTANLGAMWSTFRSAGARCLIITGEVDHNDTISSYVEAVPGARMTLIRLDASPDQLRDRVLLRGRDGGPLAADELKGQPPDTLDRIAEQAARDAEKLERAQIGDLCVETNNRTVQELTRLVLADTGWPR